MKELIDHINQSPTAFHCVATVKSELDKNGYKELFENKSWDIKNGGKFYVTRNSSSIIAFELPKGDYAGYHIFSAHSDSPSFRIKENTEMVFENNYVRLNVEKYGGMIMPTWFDRPLSVAGRVVFRDGDELKERLVNIDRDLLVIPNVAIHMNSDTNTGHAYSAQNELLPLLGDISSKDKFDELIAKEAGVKKENILGRDLFLYTRQKGSVIGAKKELLLSPRLDDQACVFAGLKGLLDSKEGKHAKVLAIFDNEEVGSGTKQGADSTFLEDTIERIAEARSFAKTEALQKISESFNVSADNAHAVHPAMPGKADPTSRPYLNKGVVVKFSGNQKYATDALSAAYFRKIAQDNKINLQTYSNNSDVPGGSTLGNISTAHLSVKTVDIGIAQLAMHSSVETMGVSDYKDMVTLATKYYED